MNTQQKWAIGGAVLGALAALTGEGSNVIDVAIGAAVLAAIAYVIGSVIANRKKNSTK